MSVLDMSAVIDLLLGSGAAEQIQALTADDGVSAAPDVVVFETIAVLRRLAARGVVTSQRAGTALDDLGDLPIDLYPSMSLRSRAWGLRDNFTAADALFVAQAEGLGESLVTRDAALSDAALRHTVVDAVLL